jgi:hypothetical protein
MVATNTEIKISRLADARCPEGTAEVAGVMLDDMNGKVLC